MLISIVIPNFNGKELLEKNLPKILEVIEKESKKEIEIIVVDDGSTDGSVEMLRRLVKDGPSGKARPLIKLVVNKKNLGFSSTVNRGVKKARGEIVILLNTDTYPKKGFLDAVLPHFNDPKVFAVGMMDESVENGKIVRHGRGVGKWERGF